MAVSFLQSRQLVRAQPYRTQKQFSQQVVAAAGLTAIFDVSLVVSDRNQLGAGNVALSLPSVGPWLDCVVRADQIGTIDILVAIGATGFSLYSILPAPLPIVAGTLLVVASGLRITGRYIEVAYVNTSANTANVELGAFVGSA